MLPLGFDIISTTLSGYTESSQDVKSVNLELIRQKARLYVQAMEREA